LGHHVRSGPAIASTPQGLHRRQRSARRSRRAEIIAYLGSIDTTAMASDGTLQSIYARDIFWEKAAPKLNSLDDRIGPNDIGRLRLAIHARIPRPTTAERTQFESQHKAHFRPRKANGKPIAVRTRVVKRRRRRPDWQPRQPRRAETYRWFQQFLEWTPSRREQYRLLIRDSIGDLPDAAYYDDDPGSSDRDGAVGTQKRNAKGPG
jgi:hypothetical protein